DYVSAGSSRIQTALLGVHGCACHQHTCRFTYRPDDVITHSRSHRRTDHWHRRCLLVCRDLDDPGIIWHRHLAPLHPQGPVSLRTEFMSLVFPLGMYSAASGYLGQANDLAIIQNIGSSWLWVAVAAWLITFIAMLGSLVRGIVQRS